MRIVVTGATGKVGQNLLPALLADARLQDAGILALCNHRVPSPAPRLELLKGSIADPATVAQAMAGATHVIHMAAVKETPDQAIDVAVKGTFLLLEAARAEPAFRQFILIGADCTVGHAFQPYDSPITETAPRRAYPGCYALTKVLEEVMVEQYQHQYDLNGCILRPPWIMEKDDFRCALAFGPEQFGGPRWDTLMPADEAAALAGKPVVPLILDRTGAALKRNFVHVSDLVTAILTALDNPAARQRLFNIAMDEPVDYASAAAILQQRHGLRPVEIATAMHSNWLDNTAARQSLGWRPRIGLEELIEQAWAWERPKDDPRIIRYPG